MVKLAIRETGIPKRNKACFFLLPLIGYNLKDFETLNDVYVGDNTNKADLTFKKLFVNVFEYEESYTHNNYFNHFYQLENGSYMFVYDIPEQYEEDFILFCDGKYSKMSQLAKGLICHKSGVKPVFNSIVYKVLHKDHKQRKYIEELVGCKLYDHEEVYSRPNLDEEIYNGAIQLKGTKI